MEETMKKRFKSKKIMILCTIVLVAAISTATVLSASSTSFDLNEYSEKNLNEYTQILKEQVEMQEEIGKEALLPELYRIEKGNEIMGESENSSINNSVDYLLEREALYNYAVSKGYKVNDDEVNNAIKAEITDAKSASNYQEIEKACETAGVSFEETMYANFATKQSGLTIDKLYADERAKFLSKNEITDIPVDSDYETEWNSLWDKITEKAVKAFKKTVEYNETKDILKENADIIKNSVDIVETVNGGDVSGESLH
jgi:hypothetical protein